MSSDRRIVERYFAAMRRGAAAEEDMMALFSDDAVYVEPFTGESRPWVGKDLVREALRRGWEQPLPDLELTVQRIEIREGGATSAWVCRSPALPAPVAGEDEYTISNGKITRLEVRIIDDGDYPSSE